MTNRFLPGNGQREMKMNNRMDISARRRGVAAIGGMVALVAVLLPALPMPASSQSGQGAASAAASGETAGNGTWTVKAPLPAARSEVAAVALDGKLHALGGVASGTSGPYHDAYDPATDTWSSRAPLPAALDQLGVAVAGGNIYAFGGVAAGAHSDVSAAAYEYDAATDT